MIINVILTYVNVNDDDDNGQCGAHCAYIVRRRFCNANNVSCILKKYIMRKYQWY